MAVVILGAVHEGRTAVVSSASSEEPFGSGPSWKSARGVPIACTTLLASRVIGVTPAPVRPVRHDAVRSVQSSG